MTTETMTVSGVVKDGVVIPEGLAKLPEGARVEIVFPNVSPELEAEMDAWDRAGQDAWKRIDQWEQEETA